MNWDTTGTSSDLDIDWDILKDALFYHDINILNQLDNGTNTTTREIHGNTDRTGDDRLSPDMYGDDSHERRNSMESEIPATTTTTASTTTEAEAYVSECMYVDAASAMRRLQLKRDRRRCDRGDCCVFNVRYDSVFSSRHTGCTHQCRLAGRSLAHCHTPLQSHSILSEFLTVNDWSHQPSDNYIKPRSFASRGRWRGFQAECLDGTQKDGIDC